MLFLGRNNRILRKGAENKLFFREKTSLPFFTYREMTMMILNFHVEMLPEAEVIMVEDLGVPSKNR